MNLAPSTQWRFMYTIHDLLLQMTQQEVSLTKLADEMEEC